MKKYSSNSLLSTNERSFVIDALKEQLRIDGRRYYDVRNIKITFGPTLGMAEVQLGLTSVSCELVDPQPERPTEGFYIFNTEFSPMAEPNFDAARPTEASIEIGRVIERGLRESRAIDTEALCVVAGVKVWSVRCDIHIIDHSGNLLDCASIATIAALLHFRRPTTSVVDNKVTIIPIEDKDPLPLSIHHIPVAISFAIFEEGEIIVVDPSLKEELVMEGRISFTLNSHREICAVQKSGGIPLSLDQIIQCSRIAAVKAEEVIQSIQTSLKATQNLNTKINNSSYSAVDITMNNKP